MDANFFDLCILLGYSKMESTFCGKCSAIIDIFAMNQTPFIKQLPGLINHLINKEKDINSKIFYPFLHFFQLMKKASKRGGNCPICDKYFSFIKDHYLVVHHMTQIQVQTFSSIISDDYMYYMPSEYRLLTNPVKASNDNGVKSILSINEDNSEMPSELNNGFYVVKNQESSEEKLICSDCGHFIPKKLALNHKKKHLKLKNKHLD